MNPKTFMSYSWTSPEHEAWVLKLATELREVGVDVILDKWDLKEGHDAIAFMEKIVTDPEIKKVILVCDLKYAEKTDTRAGGVGTEAQIISPAIYAKSGQDKFVAVAAELGPDGKPFLPTYYKGRIYIDLSSEDIYGQNFEQLTRWIYDKPVHAKPTLGKAPSYLAESDSPGLANTALHRRALDAIKNAKPYAKGAIDEYFASCVTGLEAFRIAGGEDNFDDRVVKNLEDFVPHRAQIIEVLVALAQYRDTDESRQQVHRFFEQLLPLFEPPQGTTGYHRWDFDNFKFIIHELFLYLHAVLLKHGALEFSAHMLRQPYYLSEGSRGRESKVVSFTRFYQYLEALKHRNARLKLQRMSVRADLLEQRSHASGLDFQDIMQADFVLFMRASLNELRGGVWSERWWPETLVFCDEYRGPFEIFARAQSKKSFDRLAILFDVTTKEELWALLDAFNKQQLRLPDWSFHGINPGRLIGADKLASMP
jgi:hypothetical protein